jgi:NhaP-type Na+/H+ or K+/H+ antiporter
MVIAFTLVVQGLMLPWIIKKMGIGKISEKEDLNEHLQELSARKMMAVAVYRWLKTYQLQVKDDPKLSDQIELYLKQFKMVKSHLKERISNHQLNLVHDEKREAEDVNLLLAQIIEVQRATLMQLWEREKVNFTVRNKLIEKLDLEAKRLPG